MLKKFFSYIEGGVKNAFRASFDFLIFPEVPKWIPPGNFFFVLIY